MSSAAFWRNKKVFLTGHTGFKGAWLGLWLASLGAIVTGYALKPPTRPNLFSIYRLAEVVDSIIADIRDQRELSAAIKRAKPEIVFHLAAQPLVRDSYLQPVYTYDVNVMGTVNLLEALRKTNSVRAAVIVTSDKCYENASVKGWRPFKEDDPLGGYDPYSNSKACEELVTAAYRASFLKSQGVNVATARAGNVIGGGDWAKDRIIPDFIRAIVKGEKLRIRNPQAIRPWQHVLEPLSGYLLLAEKLYQNNGEKYAEAWNFGPKKSEVKTVKWLIDYLCQRWPGRASYAIDKRKQPHEAATLTLSWSKAAKRLAWQPKWTLSQSLDKVIEWTNAYRSGREMKEFSTSQIREYLL